MIYLTGDTHCIQIKRLNSKNFPQGNNLAKDDIVIVAGDFGMIFSRPGSFGYEEQQYWLKWISDKPWTTVFVDGNHCNHEMLNELEIIEKFGGKMGKVNDSVFHARRGEIYEIDGQKILTIGGAYSVDKSSRTQGVDWWPGELLSAKDIDNAMENLKKHDYEVDYVITHTCCIDIILEYLFSNDYAIFDFDKSTENFLQYVSNNTTFKLWYFGHMHDDVTMGKYRMLYEDIVILGDTDNIITD